MKLTTAHYLNHSGTNYEIGQHLGKWILATPEAARRLQSPPGMFPVRTQEKIAAMFEMFDRYCPGVNEEIKGFADMVNIDPVQVLFYSISFFAHGCNVMALRPEKTWKDILF